MDTIRKKERRNWFYSYNMIFEQDISMQAKLIYLYLCRCADEEGQSFPSHSTIGEKCGIKSRQTVINALKELESIGLLTKENRNREDGGQTSNLYTIYDEPTPVQEMDTPPCRGDGHPPVQEIDTPCLGDGHEGLPKEGLPNNKSVSQSDGQTEPCSTVLDKLQLDELRKANPSDSGLIDEIELNIREMLTNKYTTIAGQPKSKDIIYSVLMKLTYWHIEEVLYKYKEITSQIQIKNHKSYMQNMIYNIAFEKNLKVENKINIIMSR